jgi:hypothetical protein
VSIIRRTACIGVAALALTASVKAADAPAVVISEGYGLLEKDGRGQYRAICQGCRIEYGQGTKDAAYPALATNATLVAAVCVSDTVVDGRMGMPAVGRSLSDEHVPAVTNSAQPAGQRLPRRRHGGR